VILMENEDRIECFVYCIISVERFERSLLFFLFFFLGQTTCLMIEMSIIK
jgi:hypothetical protein